MQREGRAVRGWSPKKGKGVDEKPSGGVGGGLFEKGKGGISNDSDMGERPSLR